MKLFAISFLSEYLGKSFLNYEPHQIESNYYFQFKTFLGFANHIAYIINREIDLAELDG